MGLIKTPLDDLTYRVNGLAMAVQGELKRGHRERVYQQYLRERISNIALRVEFEPRIDVYTGTALLGYMYLDLWVERSVIVECKAFDHLLTNEDVGQVITYLVATGNSVGLLYNFGRMKLEFKRILPPKSVQEWQQHLYRSVWIPRGHALPPVETVPLSSLRFFVDGQPLTPVFATSTIDASSSLIQLSNFNLIEE
jgi:GxxExxY protein